DRIATPPKMIDLESERVGMQSSFAKFELYLNVLENDDHLDLEFEYAIDLFDATTIDQFASHFQLLLKRIMERPDDGLANLSLVTPAERQRLLYDWNARYTPYPRDQCVHELFEAQARQSPDAAVAVVFGQEQLDYAELNARANRLAHYLR